MRSLAMPVISLLALSIGASAGAQIAGRHVYGDSPVPNRFIGDSRLPGPGIGRDLRDVRCNIDHARESGAITRREALRLDREARLIGSLAQRYGRDGLSPSEGMELQARISYLRDAVRRPARESRRGRGD